MNWFRTLTVCLLVASPALAKDIWRVGPQLCGGRAYSSTAKAAGWEWDEARRLAWSTPDTPIMQASLVPDKDSNFVVNVRAELTPGDVCVLTMDKCRFEIAPAEEKTTLTFNGLTTVVDLKKDSEQWTLLNIHRHDGKMEVKVNDTTVSTFDNNAQAFKEISLQATAGKVGVSHFVVTGEVRASRFVE